MRENETERRLTGWLEADGWCVCKASHMGAIDLLAARHGERWLIEVKGDQQNDRATRNAFFSGTGQIFTAMLAHGRSARYSLAVSPEYGRWAAKHLLRAHDVLAVRFSVVVVFDDGAIEEHVPRTTLAEDLAPCSSSAVERQATRPRGAASVGQGHPDGDFWIGPWRYSVAGGRLTAATHAHSQQRLMPLSFASLARALGCHVRGDSAARVVNRHRLAAEAAIVANVHTSRRAA